jgi:hypothetical protein
VKPVFKRATFNILLQRIKEPRRFIQVLYGPRQVGKATIARQVMETVSIPVHFATADEPTLRDRQWVSQQWEIARIKIPDTQKRAEALLILDEAQKITGWSEIIKRLWDEDTAAGLQLKVVLLGSSPLLVQKGLTESLAGRFEVIPVLHWSYREMSKAFGWNVEQYLVYGGYPGAAVLINDHERWARYIIDALIETTISRDILLLTRIDKPALLRRLFQLCCDYSGQIMSYQKMLGQLHDAGNTTTLAHYLDLLSGAGLITGLPKYYGKRVPQRSSSPKVQVFNTALMTAPLGLTFKAIKEDRNYWGRLVESAVGAHLINSAREKNLEVFYWRDRNQEVDFVVRSAKKLVALEVTSSRKKGTPSGMAAFCKAFPVTRQLLVGGNGIPIDEFLSTPVENWLR